MPTISLISSAEIKLSVLYIINLLGAVFVLSKYIWVEKFLITKLNWKKYIFWKNGYVFRKVMSNLDKWNHSKICFLISFGTKKCIKSVSRRHKESLKPLILLGFRLLWYYSNSIVAGGLLVQSYSTLFTPLTSLTILFATVLKTSHGIWAQSAVMKSAVHTARSATA